MEKIELRPQKRLLEASQILRPLKRLRQILQNNNTNDNKVSENMFLEVPEHIVMEWELLEIIVSFLGISVYGPEVNGHICFTSPNLKQYYEEITYQNFDKVYGINGLNVLLSFREGVKYDKSNNMWIISPHRFISQLKRDYIKDVNTYGANFDKP